LKYTSIRISVEDKRRLEWLMRLLKRENLADALRYALSAAERELDRGGGDLEKVFSSLRHAKDAGRTSAEEIDRYLYGEHVDGSG
jgi:hypothetical protein